MTFASTELKQAAFAGDLAKVRSLVSDGADVNTSSLHGAGTLLTFHPEVIEFLLSQGADPNLQTNENGASVLAGLAYVNKADCVRVLLEHGADPNRGRAESLETPLHHALAGAGASDCTELIQLLLKHGADVNAQTKPGIVSFNFWRDAKTRGETPLHRAAAFASLEAIQVLLDHGADPASRDANADSPLGWASWHRRSREIIDALRYTDE